MQYLIQTDLQLIIDQSKFCFHACSDILRLGNGIPWSSK